MFHREANQKKDPFAKNPGVNAAITDPPPDMKLKPPMKGEVDHRPNTRSTQYDGQRVGGWNKPKTILSRGDFLKGKNPNY